MAIIPLPLQGYNNRYEACWVAAAPLECSQFEGAGIPCKGAGDAIEAYAQALVFFPVYPCLVIAIMAMFSLYQSVRRTENRTAKYVSSYMSRISLGPAEAVDHHRRSVRSGGDEEEVSSGYQVNDITTRFSSVRAISSSQKDGSSDDMTATAETAPASNEIDHNMVAIEQPPVATTSTVRRAMMRSSSCQSLSASDSAQVNRIKSRQVAIQGACYILGFLCVHILFLARVIYENATGQYNHMLDVFAFAILLPSQGIFNCLVFIRQRRMKTWEGRIVRRCCCGYWPDLFKKMTTPLRRSMNAEISASPP